MEAIILSIIGLMVAVALGVTVYWLMRQQLEKAAEQSSALQEKLTAVEQQLVSAEKDLQLERQQAQELKMELSRKDLELDFERKNNADIRKQADEKLAEQIKFLQSELTNTTQRLLDVRSEKLE